MVMRYITISFVHSLVLDKHIESYTINWKEEYNDNKLVVNSFYGYYDWNVNHRFKIKLNWIQPKDNFINLEINDNLYKIPLSNIKFIKYETKKETKKN